LVSNDPGVVIVNAAVPPGGMPLRLLPVIIGKAASLVPPICQPGGTRANRVAITPGGNV
jgi:hypothetical protein